MEPSVCKHNELKSQWTCHICHAILAVKGFWVKCMFKRQWWWWFVLSSVTFFPIASLRGRLHQIWLSVAFPALLFLNSFIRQAFGTRFRHSNKSCSLFFFPFGIYWWSCVALMWCGIFYPGGLFVGISFYFHTLELVWLKGRPWISHVSFSW